MTLIFGDQQRTRTNVDQIGTMTFLFWRSTENSEKSRPTQNFGPPRNNFWPPPQKQILPPKNNVLVADLRIN